MRFKTLLLVFIGLFITSSVSAQIFRRHQSTIRYKATQNYVCENGVCTPVESPFNRPIVEPANETATPVETRYRIVQRESVPIVHESRSVVTYRSSVPQRRFVIRRNR